MKGDSSIKWTQMLTNITSCFWGMRAAGDQLYLVMLAKAKEMKRVGRCP